MSRFRLGLLGLVFAVFLLVVPFASAASPVITVPSDITAEATGPSGAVATFTATATDDVDGTDPVTCTPDSGSTFPIATTTVSCSATDSDNNTSTATFHVTVRDTTPPSIAATANINTSTTNPAGRTVSYTRPTATDLVDGTDPVTCAPASGATFAIGTTTVNCSSTDAHGNTGTSSFTVTVTLTDTTPPVVTPPSNMTVAATSSSGAVVTFTATATDNVDGPLTPTCTPASGSTFPLGVTTVTCRATDAHGNTGTATFTITVSDTTPPVVTVPANMTVNSTSASGVPVTFTATATDNIDGALTPTCTPASGSTFPIATTTVTCRATDAHGNTGTASFTVKVVLVDTTPPVVKVPANMTVTATGPTGAVATFTATATDNIDGALTPTCTPASGSTFPVATTTVTCRATDAHGNTGSASFTVTVVDKTAPTFQGIPSDPTVEANGPSGSVVHYTAPTATDDVDGPIAVVTCVPASGAVFALGATTVTCSATDSHGNTGTASFVVHVVDTTPPHLIVPGNGSVYASSPTSASVSDADVVAWLSSASASDLADPHPSVSNDAPTVLPLGTNTVTFVARDASGNSVSATAKLTVLPQPAAGTTPPPLPPLADRQPPDNVSSLLATAGDGIVTLTWKKPAAADFASVTITRSTSTGTAATIVYRGTATSFVDHNVKDGTDYRYIVVTLDKSGNSSAGVAVVATPKRSALRTPQNGAKLTKPPSLTWTAAPNAGYYNVQLFRGKTKILSAWPAKPTLTLQTHWTFAKTKYRLTPGTYHWYVWPGFGPRPNAKYGTMLGTSTFTISP